MNYKFNSKNSITSFMKMKQNENETKLFITPKECVACEFGETTEIVLPCEHHLHSSCCSRLNHQCCPLCLIPLNQNIQFKQVKEELKEESNEELNEELMNESQIQFSMLAPGRNRPLRLPADITLYFMYQSFFEEQVEKFGNNASNFYRSSFDFDASFLQWTERIIERVLIRYDLNPFSCELRQRILYQLSNDLDKFKFCFHCFFLSNIPLIETYIFHGMSHLVGIICYYHLKVHQ